MDEYIKNLHRENHRKGMEMYKAGVDTGIRFSVDTLFHKFPAEVRQVLVDQITKDYDNE